MNKELALRTFAYLIWHYKTHNETTINEQEIEAIEFMLKNNEDLEQQCKKQKKINQKAIEYIKKAQLGEFPTGVIYWLKDDEVGKILLQILEDKEVLE